MIKYLKNTLVMSTSILISSLLITSLYCFKSPESSFWLNELFVILSIVGMVVCGSVFLLATDSIFCRGRKFKERFIYVIKSLWLSQCVILPVVLCLFLVNAFFNLILLDINKVIVFSISYLSQFTLFFSYKFITDYDWSTTIKVVASQFILTSLLTSLMKFI